MRSVDIEVHIQGEDYDSITKDGELPQYVEEMFRGYTFKGNWEKVKQLYEFDVKFCTVKINKSRGTALHVAVNEGNESVVRSLVASILLHNNTKALEVKNEKGDTPLHLAASRGFKEICEHIIGKEDKRMNLISIRNKNGETPVFLASLSWQKESFMYLFSLFEYDYKINAVKKDYFYYNDLIRKNGDTILHCAISREFFDLAIIVIDKFPVLGEIPNKEGYTPLKLLATRPSAFKSGCNMIWWKKILYHCISVENLNIEKAIKSYDKKQDQDQDQKNSYPKNYETCSAFLQKCQEYINPHLSINLQKCQECINPHSSINSTGPTTDVVAYDNKEKDQKISSNHQQQINISMSSNNEEKSKHVLLDQQQMDISKPLDRELLPENYDTCLYFLRFACIYIFGLSGVGVDEVRKMKQKHKWCSQLLNILKITYSSIGSGTEPLQNESGIDISRIDFPETYIPNQALESEDANKSTTLETEKAKKKAEILKSETPILTAARYGIVEMVKVLIKEIPSSIYETNLENKNILLVAVENRRTVVVELLKKWFKDRNETKIFENLIQDVDNEDNTVLHLAATPSNENWYISGAALQMTWHIKWFQYAKELVPEHFTVRTNKEDKTAGEIFKEKHTDLVGRASEWLKYTSESCSVVAALLAGVSFATSSTIPGGNKSETGEPALEGKPLFDAFALSSVIGLCFSVTALIMFLSILTSRREVKDFKIDLPGKLLLGLSSLFLSITAMFITFCSGNFFLIDKQYKHIMFLIYTIACSPVTLYAIAQLPLYIDLVIGILTKIPMTRAKGEDL